jgi:hypothetical protein
VQYTNNIRQYSRKPRPVGALAGQIRLLRQFANLRDEDAEKFRGQHPEFLLAGHLKESGWELGVMLRLGMTAGATARARALAQVQPNPVLRKRDALRLIWRSDEYANDYLRLLLYSSSSTTDRVEFNWKRGEIVYQPKDDFEKAVYVLFRNSALAKVCENEGCPAPYFIATRSTQRYCSPDCAAIFQQKWKLDWWKRVGSKKRSEGRAKKKKAKKGR